MSTDTLPNGGPSRPERGVVEEVISKRLKALTKKIIRIKAYGNQPAQSLNNDQKSAMASLPTLEAVARELEDLIKPGGPVETAELSQAGISREQVRAAKSEAEALGEGMVDSFSDTLAKRLSQFLRLHTLLHPARARQHLVNGDRELDLDLPTHLQDKVSPSDVQRVGRLYDDLIAAGGDKRILQVFGGRSVNAKEGDDHVVELLDLMDVPQSSQHFEAEDEPRFGSADIEAPEVEELDREARTRQWTDHSAETRTSDDGLPLGASTSQAGGAVESATPPTLNFLQEDELVSRPDEPIEPVAIEEPSVSEPPAPLAVQKESAVTQPTQPIAASPKIDWTADDDDDEEPIFSTRQTSSVQINPSPPIEGTTITPVEADQPAQIALAQETDTQTPDSSTAVEAPTSVESPSKPAPGPTSRASGSKRGKGRTGKTQTQARPALAPQSSSQKKVVDDDGFEQVFKKHAQTQQQQGGGRGGAGGRGGSGQRGRGRPTGDRGRGLPSRPTGGVPNGGTGAGQKAKSGEKALYKSDVVANAKP